MPQIEPMTETLKSDLRMLMEALRKDASEYFKNAARSIKEEEKNYWPSNRPADYFWRQISDEDLEIARSLAKRLVRYNALIADGMRNAPLVGQEDLVDLRNATKVMRAALSFRLYQFHDAEILNDEDRVLGIRQARQTENEPLSPHEADAVFHDSSAQILRILTFIEASAELSPSGHIAPRELDAARYRPGTAFIMMWMDPSRPELADIVDTVKETFRKFGFNAVRADDIEHDGQITQRVLNELRTSEFLFADLTGARPNVYYEVGFAHALGRRVVLYRQAGTGIHFDLAGYNCPEYTNMRDLREKLTKRLESMTNRVVGIEEDDI